MPAEYRALRKALTARALSLQDQAQAAYTRSTQPIKPPAAAASAQGTPAPHIKDPTSDPAPYPASDHDAEAGPSAAVGAAALLPGMSAAAHPTAAVTASPSDLPSPVGNPTAAQGATSSAQPQVMHTDHQQAHEASGDAPGSDDISGSGMSVVTSQSSQPVAASGTAAADQVPADTPARQVAGTPADADVVGETQPPVQLRVVVQAASAGRNLTEAGTQTDD